MGRIQGIGGNADLLHQLLEKTRTAGGASELPPAAGFHGRAARQLTNGEGKTLYEARESIMESMRSALDSPGSDGVRSPGTVRDAMTLALRENGFDPDEVRGRMEPAQTESGVFGANDPFTQGLGKEFASSDVFIQQLLAQLPPGSTVDREA